MTPARKPKTLAERLVVTVDRMRSFESRLGFRPRRAFLVWQKWTGEQRGEGERIVVCRSEILPRPVIDDGGISKSKAGAGAFPTGSIRVTEISAKYRLEHLNGTVLPDERDDQVSHPYEFFWEIVEDERHGPSMVRRKFHVGSEPSFSAEDFGWSLMLDRTSDDPDRDGCPVDDPVEPPVQELAAVAPPAPPDDDF